MKTLIIILFSAISCFGQSYMTKMDVIEVLEDTTYYTNSVKVVWAIGRWGDVSFIWENKGLYFDEQLRNPTRKQKRRTKEIRDKYQVEERRRKYDKNVKHHHLYLNKWNEIFLITVYMDREILIWVSRVDGKFPCYFFRTVNVKL